MRKMCQIAACKMLWLACLLELACLICLCHSCVYKLHPLLFFFLHCLLLSYLSFDVICYIAGGRRPAVAISCATVSCIYNKIALQPASAEECLHLDSLIQRIVIASLQQLVLFLAVHAHCVNVNCNKAAVLLSALKAIKRLSKLLNQRT
jgi:hypothetical protein